MKKYGVNLRFAVNANSSDFLLF